MMPTWFLAVGSFIVYLAITVAFGGLVYVALIKVFDWWVKRPTDTLNNLLVQAGILLPAEARQRMRTELANGEIVLYNTCKHCGQLIMEGDTQLEAWQAYSKHVADRHQ